MRHVKFLYHRGLVAAFAVCAACVLPGCQEAARTGPGLDSSSLERVFYPPAPDRPRLQFLVSFSESEDLGSTVARKTSRFEKFIVGEEQLDKDWIAKPYGVAIHDGKLYVCDVQKKIVEVLDLRRKSFGYLTKERRMMNPVNIHTEDGRKFIADPTGGKVFVFGKDNELKAVLGSDLKLKPIDVAVRGKRCYITDMNSSQVVVLDIATGEELTRIGKAGDQEGQFGLIGDIALDEQENIYVTDKIFGRITKFDKNGVFQQTIGKVGDSIHHFVRPKGIDIDREDRIWVVDAAPEVAKVYDSKGQLLMFFGFPGSEPGNMNMPASITIDYDNVDLFEQYFAEGAKIEFLVLVSNQYGEKINVYGFGTFPIQEKAIERAKKLVLEPEPEDERTQQVADTSTPATVQPEPKVEPTKGPGRESAENQMLERQKAVAELYYRSMALYRGGKLQEAREGFLKVAESGLIPAPMAKTVRGYIAEIDSALAKRQSRER
ncbi:MAG: hypothetical protein JSU70_17830 [Phycisphaerales bacterium]|nr:MAG: hypothetical protein JSU70_17830 [Phycisphaerales bacterium]